MKFRQIIIVAFSTIVLSLAASCQSDKSTIGGVFGLDTDLKMAFQVEADTNPDENGIASPLFIRMYELKADKIYSKSDFIDVFERDKEILGADLVKSHQLKGFKPGESRDEIFVLDEKTKYVGLYAEFLKFKTSKFKIVFPVVTNNVFKNSVTVRVTGNELILIE